MEEMIEQCTQMMNMMQGMGGMMGGGMMVNGVTSGAAWWASPWYWLGWVVVLAVLVILFAFVWAIRHASRSAPRAEVPLDILKRRYARGEVSAEQFETMKRQLAQS